MKSILTIILSFLLIVSGLAQTRNVVVGTNDVIVQPTNFWSANASNGRTGLGLGSAATNPASAFQPSSSVLSNLSSSNGINITNLQSSNIVGAISVSNFIGTLAIASGGTGATNAGGARTNLGLGWSALTNTNAATSLLGFTTNGEVVANTVTNVLTFTNTVRFDDGSGDFTSITGPQINTADPNTYIAWGTGVWSFGGKIEFSGTNATSNAAATRANLGFSTNLNTFWTATNAAQARQQIFAAASTIQTEVANEAMVLVDDDGASPRLSYEALGGDGWTISDESGFRSAINLSLPALTNTNNANFLAAFFGSNTNPVLVNTNGTVVSPTNFWQVAPIQTLVQDFTGITVSQTNNATNARNVYVYSLATNVSGISNTIILPTNTSTFNGDEVTVIHKGTTNATTVVRQAGSTNNLITLNRFDESVKFIRELGQWDFYHNISFVEPIQFSGTNVSVNAAASRTNLGLGSTNQVTFGRLYISNTNVGSFEGLANLINSNNTTISNETLFRVGLAEATNRSAQFGFRTVRTNNGGEGFATFSVYGYNALMMIGPSDRSRTNTNAGTGIEADIYSISETNKVATLIDTNTSAFTFHRVVGFRTNETNGSPAGGGGAYADRDRWLEIYVGTNKFYIPLFE